MKHSRFASKRIIETLEFELGDFNWRRVDTGEGWIICHDGHVPVKQRIQSAEIEANSVKTEMTRVLPFGAEELTSIRDMVNLSKEKWSFILSGQALTSWPKYDQVKDLNSKCPLCEYSSGVSVVEDFCFVCPIEYSGWCAVKYQGDMLKQDRAWAEGTKKKDIEEIIMILSELSEVITSEIEESK